MRWNILERRMEWNSSTQSWECSSPHVSYMQISGGLNLASIMPSPNVLYSDAVSILWPRRYYTPQYIKRGDTIFSTLPLIRCSWMIGSHIIDPKLLGNEKVGQGKSTYLEANITVREATSVSNIITTQYSGHPQNHKNQFHLASSFLMKSEKGESPKKDLEGKCNAPNKRASREIWQ